MTKVKKAKPDTISTIRKAMKACQKNGLQIDYGTWGTCYDREKKYFVPEGDDARVCALGALLIYKNGSIKYNPTQGRNIAKDNEQAVAAYVLGVDTDWVTAFVNGFDGDSYDKYNLNLTVDFDKDGKNSVFAEYECDKADTEEDCGRDTCDGVMYTKKINKNYEKTLKTAKQREMFRAYAMGVKLHNEFID